MRPADNPTPQHAGGRVVFHADDLGFSPAVTDGIIRGFEQGLLTSTSLLANAPDAPRALEQWRSLQQRHAAAGLPSAAVRRRLDDPPRPFDLGIHLNLTQGRPLTGQQYPSALLDGAGRFPGAGPLFWRLVRHGAQLRAAVEEELRCQLQFLLDHGVRPTHLNGHQYVEMMPVVAGVAAELLAEFGIGVVRIAREPRLWRSTLGSGFGVHRWLLGHVKRAFARGLQRRLGTRAASPEAFFGSVHAGRIDMRLLCVWLNDPKSYSLAEIGMHPAEAAAATAGDRSADNWDDPLAIWRPDELRLLLSERLARHLESRGFRLGRLSDLRVN